MFSSWIRLQDCPSQQLLSNIVKLDDNAFITCGEKTSWRAKCNIYKYNTNTSKWSHIPLHDTSGGSSILCNNSIAIHVSSHTLYSFGNTHFVVGDIKNGTIKQQLSITEHNGGKYHNCCSLMIGDEYHIIGGKKNVSHLIWNQIDNTLKVIHNFGHLSYGLQKPGFVHIESKQMCLLFGGYDDGEGEAVDAVWMFCLKVNKWSKLEIKLPFILKDFGYCLSKNERFIVIFGGMRGKYRSDTDTIFVLDLELMQFKQCKLKAPAFSEFRAITMHDKSMEIILNRMIRQNCCAHKLFPNDIIELIEAWIGTECVYLVERIMGFMWQIRLADILFQIDEK